MVDDPSIGDEIVLLRRIQPRCVQFDADGNPVISDGAFRTKELSLFRSDRVTVEEVLDGYPNDGLAEIGAQEVRMRASFRPQASRQLGTWWVIGAILPAIGFLPVRPRECSGQRN
jgi:hypothetical protein